MSKVKLQTSKNWKAGQINILTIIGEVKFSEDAIIEVESELVDELIEIMPEFSIVNIKEEKKEEEKEVEEKIKPQVEEIEIGKGDDSDSLKPQTDDSEILGSTETVESISEEAVKPSKEEIIVALSEKKVAELKEMLLQFAEEEYKDLTKKDQYIHFLADKLSQ